MMSEENNVEPSDLDIAKSVLNPLLSEDITEEELVVALIQFDSARFKFAKAGRLMNQVLESAGMRMNAKDRYAAANELLSSWEFFPESWDDIDGAVENLVEHIESTSKAQALSCVRRFAKDNEIELPEKPKAAKGGIRKASAFARFQTWALSNKDATDEDVKGFIDGLGVTEKQAAKYTARYLSTLSFAREFASA